MKQPILVTYRSVTGFTQQYAQWIAEALGGAAPWPTCPKTTWPPMAP